MITREQAGAIAALVRTVRPAWDQLAIMATIGELQDRDPADAAHAAIRAAQDPAAKTPKAIAFGDYWRTEDKTESGQRARAEREHQERLESNRKRAQAVLDCAVCDEAGYLESGHLCNHHLDQTRTTYRRGAELARAALTERTSA